MKALLATSAVLAVLTSVAPTIPGGHSVQGVLHRGADTPLVGTAPSAPAHTSAARSTSSLLVAPVPALEVPYDSSGGYIVLPVTIQGHTLHLILDHGTDITLLSNSVAAQLGLSEQPRPTLTLGASVLPQVPVRQADLPFGTYDGVLGARELAHYDFVFDGPARQVRLYAMPGRGAHGHTHASWLPPGVTPADCTPMLHDARYPQRVFFTLRANGNALHSMFDSGARLTNINMAALHGLGLSDQSPNVQPTDGQDCTVVGCSILQATQVPLTVGRQHIRLTDAPIHVFQDLPRETGPDDPELSLGLYQLLDRVFVVSYSTRQVCVSPALQPTH